MTDAEGLQAAVQTYAARQPSLRQVAESLVDFITSKLDDAGINYLTVTGRAKSVASFAAKAGRTVDGTAGGELSFPDPLSEIGDQIGIRVITYVQGDVAAVVNLIADQTEILDDRDLGNETASEGRFGYASRHLQIAMPEDVVRATGTTSGDLPAQVQIRTVLQHAWAEFEHDIRYKGTIAPEHVSDFDRRFTLAAGLLELADREFSTIRDRVQGGIAELPVPPDDDPRLHPQELAAYLAGQYVGAAWSRTDHYAWIAGLLLELGIASFDELSEVLAKVDSDHINATLGYAHPPSAVRRLDDALLWTHGEDYVRLHGNAHRTDLLNARLAKMRP